MANDIRTGDPRGFNKGRSSKFREGSRVRQIPEEGWRTYRLKSCGNNNKYEDYSPKTLHDKNHLTSFQKFRQLIQWKRYSAFPKAPALLEPPYQIVLCNISGHSLWGGVLTLCRDAIGVFYSLSYWANKLFRFMFSKTECCILSTGILNCHYLPCTLNWLYFIYFHEQGVTESQFLIGCSEFSFS